MKFSSILFAGFKLIPTFATKTNGKGFQPTNEAHTTRTNMKRYATHNDGKRCYEFVTSSDYYFMQRVAQGARCIYPRAEVRSINN